MRVAFAGTCQVSGLRSAAQSLRPDIDYVSYHLYATATAAEIRAGIAGSDLVVTQIPDDHPEGPVLGPSALEAAGLRAILVPSFVFRGLHPDIVYITKPSALRGPIGGYHSVVVAAARLLGLKAPQIARLLNAHVLSALGLLGGYADARAATIGSFARHGFDLAPGFDAWEAAGDPFVYIINHPKIAVLSTVATLVMARAGLVASGTPPPRGLADPLAGAIVAPVLPAVARRIGMTGSTTWLEQGTVGDPAREVSLAAYAERARAIYKGQREVLLAHPGVATAYETLGALLAAATYPAPARSLASATPI